MREQILAVEDLIAKGHAYETPTGVYFSVSSFGEYGKLSGNRDQDDLIVGSREVVQDDNKRDPRDFALWKKDDKHLMQWFSPWGWGFPGWHLECSCMSRSYLGDTIDLHGGGEDLVFPHHECEIAQSEGLTGKEFSTHWMHVRFLQVDGEKMAKSRGNYYTTRDLIEGKAVNPLALRFALLSAPYGKPFNFTLQTLADFSRHTERIGEAEKRIAAALGTPAAETPGSPTPEFQRIYDEALDAMLDNLNTSVAVAKALEGVKAILREAALDKVDAEGAAWFLHRINDLLGIVRSEYGIAGPQEGPVVDDSRIQALVDERIAAKKAKDFARADAIRQHLSDEGIELRDTPSGSDWKRKSPL
jgi:cysteinyl-tRNA synthetase